ncbi:uncharacterized protein PRCAT00001205001 [Priceomyces carsonii]|uniref:uncharacterized protein n=1 Tax=Priceomyces carsonii TaxID=28549 RepID=UPI002ED862C8|nr:unnamed protein product [Priceomyces carsonii]
MKVANLVSAAFILANVNAVVVDAKQTDSPLLEKRYKDKIINKDYKKLMEEKNGNVEEEELPQAWVRVYSSTITEIVTPTVIASVTFSAKPPAQTNGLEPWVSLDKQGAPKTILPKMKGGHIKNASPTYGTWFATATTVTYNKEQLKAHNMKDSFTERKMIPENPEDHELDPLIRCTPEGYSKKGLAKDVLTEPFCFPRDNVQWKKDKTYFVTWYSKFFEKDVKNVKLNLFYVKEGIKQKGTKRDLSDLGKRSVVVEKGGKVLNKPFFSSGWIDKEKGYFPITVDEEWIGENEFYRKVLLSIEPDNVVNEEESYLKSYVVVEIQKGARVSKEHLQDLKKLEEKWRNQHLDYDIEEGIDYEKYIVMLTMPLLVVVAGLGMYLFVHFNKRYIDLSHLKKRKFAGKNTTHARIPFRRKKVNDTQLPQYNLTNNEIKND